MTGSTVLTVTMIMIKKPEKLRTPLSKIQSSDRLHFGLPVLMIAMLATASSTAAGVAGDTSQCFVEGLTKQIEIHPGVHQQKTMNDDPVMFSNAVATPVTVTCPLNVHPALDIEGAVIEVVSLNRGERLRSTGDSMATFSCALMSRSADGGQATGRRVTRNHAGPIYLPQTAQAQTSAIEKNEARYRYIQCELPGYSAIRHFSTDITVSDAAVIERHKLVEALKDAELEVSGQPGFDDDLMRAGNRLDAN